MNTEQTGQNIHAFTAEAQAAIHQAIFSRRDVRGQFLPKAVPDEVLSHIITAAHYAPSVGFMQPWNFLVVRSDEIKRKVYAAFADAHAKRRRCLKATNAPHTRRSSWKVYLSRPSASASLATASVPTRWWWGAPT